MISNECASKMMHSHVNRRLCIDTSLHVIVVSHVLRSQQDLWRVIWAAQPGQWVTEQRWNRCITERMAFGRWMFF